MVVLVFFYLNQLGGFWNVSRYESAEVQKLSIGELTALPSFCLNSKPNQTSDFLYVRGKKDMLVLTHQQNHLNRTRRKNQLLLWMPRRVSWSRFSLPFRMTILPSFGLISISNLISRCLWDGVVDESEMTSQIKQIVVSRNYGQTSRLNYKRKYQGRYAANPVIISM